MCIKVLTEKKTTYRKEKCECIQELTGKKNVKCIKELTEKEM